MPPTSLSVVGELGVTHALRDFAFDEDWDEVADRSSVVLVVDLDQHLLQVLRGGVRKPQVKTLDELLDGSDLVFLGHSSREHLRCG